MIEIQNAVFGGGDFYEIMFLSLFNGRWNSCAYHILVACKLGKNSHYHCCCPFNSDELLL